MTNLFGAVLYSLATVFQRAIDLRGDLVYQNLVLSLMAQSKRGADGERSQVIEAFGDLLVGIRGKQRYKLILQVWRTDNTLTQSTRDGVEVGGKPCSAELQFRYFWQVLLTVTKELVLHFLRHFFRHGLCLVKIPISFQIKDIDQVPNSTFSHVRLVSCCAR